MLESFEKIPVKIYKNPTEGSNALAVQIAHLIKEKQGQKVRNKFLVLRSNGLEGNFIAHKNNDRFDK